MNKDHEKITARAYQISRERIGSGKAPLDDWLKAEWEVKNSRSEETEQPGEN
jgi:hypothetical protein